MKTKRTNILKDCLKDLGRDLRQLGLVPKFGDGYLNIARPDGVNCEFYPCYSSDYAQSEMYTATYTVDGREQAFDIEVPQESDYFIEVVCKILDWKQGGIK